MFLDQFDLDHEEYETKQRRLQNEIHDECEKYIQVINNYKNLYIDSIDKHRRTYKPLFVEIELVY